MYNGACTYKRFLVGNFALSQVMPRFTREICNMNLQRTLKKQFYLQVAALNSHEELVHLLLEKGADPDIRNEVTTVILTF